MKQLALIDGTSTAKYQIPTLIFEGSKGVMYDMVELPNSHFLLSVDKSSDMAMFLNICLLMQLSQFLYRLGIPWGYFVSELCINSNPTPMKLDPTQTRPIFSILLQTLWLSILC